MHMHVGLVEVVVTAATVILTLAALRLAAISLAQNNADSPWAKALGVLAM